LIVWILPFASEIKLNTDGCWYDLNNGAGFGGAFRDHTATWILGFFGRLDGSSSLEAEIWVICTFAEV